MYKLKSKINKGSILILSGPSGCGKSSLLKELYKKIDNYYFSISTTTREPRKGEVHGIDYFFVSKEDFESGIKNNNFLEFAKVHNNYYGTSAKEVNNALEQSKLVIFDIDVQGHDLVQNIFSDITTSIFITTPSSQELKNRLLSRNTDSDSSIINRLKNAKEEIKHISKYDYLIIYDNLKESVKQLISISFAAKLKMKLFNSEDIITSWENK